MHQDKRGYWYESRRIGNRVTKQYLGNNAFASLLVQSDAMLRPQEAAARARRADEAERASTEAVAAPVEAACDAIENLMRDALGQAGYSQHKRGEWRKRRQPHGN